MRFFGATFFLEVEAEDEVISVTQGQSQSMPYDGSQSIAYGWCGLAMDLGPCLESHRIGQRPLVSSESE